MKNAKPIAIHLDRLASALARQGVEMKRWQLLEVAAAAFGHRSSNETSKFAESGEMTPPSAQPIGRIDLGPDSVVLVRDATTDMPYAVSSRFLEDVAENRGDQFSPTPYGGLADLRRVAISEIPLLTRPIQSASEDDWSAVVQTGYGYHGHTFFRETTAAGLATEIAAWCVEHWDDAIAFGRDVPDGEKRKRLSDLEVIGIYFEAMVTRECLLMDGMEGLSDILDGIRRGILAEASAPSRASAPRTIRDGRFRAYPGTTDMSGMPVEDDYLSSHDTLEEAIAVCEASRHEWRDACVADHVGRLYWRASYGWKPKDMPEPAVPEGDDTTTFHLNAEDLLQSELCDELHRIADLIENGYREGETLHRGWWWRILSHKAYRDANDFGERGDCQRCDSTLDVDGLCTDETCPFSECQQDDPKGWSGHPEMDPEIVARWQPPEGITPLRAARIQHAIMSALDNGLIDKDQAEARLHARLEFSTSLARAVVDGNHKGTNA